jgi:hypothetical protein
LGNKKAEGFFEGYNKINDKGNQEEKEEKNMDPVKYKIIGVQKNVHGA